MTIISATTTTEYTGTSEIWQNDKKYKNDNYHIQKRWENNTIWEQTWQQNQRENEQ